MPRARAHPAPLRGTHTPRQAALEAPSPQLGADPRPAPELALGRPPPAAPLRKSRIPGRPLPPWPRASCAGTCADRPPSGFQGPGSRPPAADAVHRGPAPAPQSPKPAPCAGEGRSAARRRARACTHTTVRKLCTLTITTLGFGKLVHSSVACALSFRVWDTARRPHPDPRAPHGPNQKGPSGAEFGGRSKPHPPPSFSDLQLGSQNTDLTPKPLALRSDCVAEL